MPFVFQPVPSFFEIKPSQGRISPVRDFQCRLGIQVELGCVGDKKWQLTEKALIEDPQPFRQVVLRGSFGQQAGRDYGRSYGCWTRCCKSIRYQHIRQTRPAIM